MKKPRRTKPKKPHPKKNAKKQSKAQPRAPRPIPTDPRAFISKRQIAILGAVNPWTVDRWRRDPALSFPVPRWFGDQTARWQLSEILEWLQSRPRETISPEWRGRRQAQAQAAVRGR